MKVLAADGAAVAAGPPGRGDARAGVRGRGGGRVRATTRSATTRRAPQAGDAGRAHAVRRALRLPGPGRVGGGPRQACSVPRWPRSSPRCGPAGAACATRCRELLTWPDASDRRRWSRRSSRPRAPRRWHARATPWRSSWPASYPGDPGVLVALLLNQVRLAPGEAIWMPAGNLHAYLRGAGVEIMASDNVLRGGLTPKRVDVGELLRVLRFEAGAGAADRAGGRRAPGVGRGGCRCAEFALHPDRPGRRRAQPRVLPARAGRACCSACRAGRRRRRHRADGRPVGVRPCRTRRSTLHGPAAPSFEARRRGPQWRSEADPGRDLRVRGRAHVRLPRRGARLRARRSTPAAAACSSVTELTLEVSLRRALEVPDDDRAGGDRRPGRLVRAARACTSTPAWARPERIGRARRCTALRDCPERC